MKCKSKYPGIVIRGLAFIIDHFVLFAFFALSHHLLYGTWIRHLPDTNVLFITHPICITFLVIYFFYFVFLEGITGVTIGKFICGIKVFKENGQPCNIRAALIRNILRIVDGLFFT